MSKDSVRVTPLVNPETIWPHNVRHMYANWYAGVVLRADRIFKAAQTGGCKITTQTAEGENKETE